ncbi:MAG TPA: type II toxin-antitoxin system RelE/ParE family toxin [Gammaproteobacteria bacterium]|jgi:plasmid stabilization system protein ParE|nr:type II toxin-antitoxin system RelE/ParE family toxin [Gammaproteobacteria bacterium]
MADLQLTDRAMFGLSEIRDYSINQFGVEVANRYIEGVQNGLLLIKEHPGLLQTKDKASGAFSFYPVQKHHLVCAEIEDTIIVLTVTHCQIDLISRLAELEPMLLEEANILFESLKLQ